MAEVRGSDARERGRADLHAWRAAQPKNFFTTNHQLERLLRHYLRDLGYAEYSAHMAQFGGVAATVLDEAAIVNNRVGNLPRLERWSDLGDRIEAVDNHPSYDICGRAIYESGTVIAAYTDKEPNLQAQVMFYLSSHTGEAGHNCPVACTAGLVKALRGAGSPELKERWLPGLLTSIYDRRLDGAQFLTEVQGGSDVGANAVEARPDGEAMGTTRWRIHGEKWFCSNAEADLILMTARVQGSKAGTGGLGLFLVPRLLDDGSLNAYRLRRLKEKLGTRSMPSAEIDFDGALAYAVGPVESGFHTVMRYVINTSRLYNSVGCAGIARRAHLVAEGYARHRQAFGQPVVRFPLVCEMLAQTRAVSSALLAGCLELAVCVDREESGGLDAVEAAFLRVAINVVKMRSCQHSHRSVLTAIEMLGGNGAIETFSVLPRLLRDNVVYENWEGTHNTLLAQTVRDFARLRLHEGFLAGLRARLGAVPETLQASLGHAWAALEEASRAIDELLAEPDPGVAALLLRPHAEALADIFFVAMYAADVAREGNEARRQAESYAVERYCELYLADQRPRHDAGYAKRMMAVAALER
jgi:acyl-CoA dehydrogenase